jgi:hypothetical protein
MEAKTRQNTPKKKKNPLIVVRHSAVTGNKTLAFPPQSWIRAYSKAISRFSATHSPPGSHRSSYVALMVKVPAAELSKHSSHLQLTAYYKVWGAKHFCCI